MQLNNELLRSGTATPLRTTTFHDDHRLTWTHTAQMDSIGRPQRDTRVTGHGRCRDNRRQHTAEVEQIMRSLAARGYLLHAFGAKVLGLGRYADAISSSDSASWSFRGRYVPGCSPSHRSESNCLRFALAWHTRLLTSLRTEEPGHKSNRKPTSPRSKRSLARAKKSERTRPGSPRPRQARGRTAARAQNSPAA